VLRQWLDRQNSPPPFFRYDQQTGFRLPLVSALLALALYRTPYDHFDGSPVDGLSRNSPWLGGLLKSNMLFNVPASASKEPGIRSPPSQLSSMKRRIDVLVGQSVIDIVVPGEKAKRDSRRGPLRYVLLRMETGDEYTSSKQLMSCRNQIRTEEHLRDITLTSRGETSPHKVRLTSIRS
jgi:hypothetical protein